LKNPPILVVPTQGLSPEGNRSLGMLPSTTWQHTAVIVEFDNGFPLAAYYFFNGNVQQSLFEYNTYWFLLATYCFLTGNMLLSLCECNTY
jgi:hypothetical protein